MINFNEVWTEARVSRLTALWAAGMSSAAIAADLRCFVHCGDGGRSAVIGKIHRLKLPSPAGKMVRSHRQYAARAKQEPLPRGENKPLNRSFDASPPPAPRPGRIASNSRSLGETFSDAPQRRNPSHNILAKIAIAEAEPGLPERLKGEPPDGTGIKLRDLESGQCKWPRGDPLDADFEFCGGKAITDRPYCAHHTRMAYAPPRARAQADKWALHRADTTA